MLHLILLMRSALRYIRLSLKSLTTCGAEGYDSVNMLSLFQIRQKHHMAGARHKWSALLRSKESKTDVYPRNGETGDVNWELGLSTIRSL